MCSLSCTTVPWTYCCKPIVQIQKHAYLCPPGHTPGPLFYPLLRYNASFHCLSTVFPLSFPGLQSIIGPLPRNMRTSFVLADLSSTCFLPAFRTSVLRVMHDCSVDRTVPWTPCGSLFVLIKLSNAEISFSNLLLLLTGQSLNFRCIFLICYFQINQKSPWPNSLSLPRLCQN